MFLFIVSDITFLVNARGQMALLYKDNVFYTNRRYKDTTFWQCQDYRRKGCKCRCVTNSKGQIKTPKLEHSHPPNIKALLNTSFVVTTPKNTEYGKRLRRNAK